MHANKASRNELAFITKNRRRSHAKRLIGGIEEGKLSERERVRES